MVMMTGCMKFIKTKFPFHTFIEEIFESVTVGEIEDVTDRYRLIKTTLMMFKDLKDEKDGMKNDRNCSKLLHVSFI